MQVLSHDLMAHWKQTHRSTAGVSTALDKWVSVVEKSEWRIPSDVKLTFNSADIIGSAGSKTLVVFDIKGNGFRLIASINFTLGWVFPRDFLTHSGYVAKCPITLALYP